jgi:hypothetical protein
MSAKHSMNPKENYLLKFTEDKITAPVDVTIMSQ